MTYSPQDCQLVKSCSWNLLQQRWRWIFRGSAASKAHRDMVHTPPRTPLQLPPLLHTHTHTLHFPLMWWSQSNTPQVCPTQTCGSLDTPLGPVIRKAKRAAAHIQEAEAEPSPHAFHWTPNESVPPAVGCTDATVKLINEEALRLSAALVL